MQPEVLAIEVQLIKALPLCKLERIWRHPGEHNVSIIESIISTEDCKLVVTCKMQNRNATDKLN